MKTLAEVILDHKFGDEDFYCSRGWTPGGFERGWGEQHAEHIVDAYREARTITTLDELHALPDCAAILDREGDVSQLRGGEWCGYETSPLSPARMAKYLPALVIYLPGEEES